MKLCRLGLLVAGMVVGAGSLDAQTTLRFQFKEGDKLEYSLEQKMHMSTRDKDKDINVHINQSMDMSWEVLKVDKDGAGQVKMKFTRVKMDMEGPMRKVQVDSKKPKDLDDSVGKTLSQVAETLAGLEVTFTMEPTGNIKDLQMPEKVKNKLKTMAGAEAMGELFSDDGLKKMANGGIVLPKEAVTMGKTWKHKVDMKVPMGKVTGNIEFTYQGTEDKEGKKLEKISAKPEIKTEPTADAPFQMKIKSQDGKGTVYFDNQTGKLLEVTMIENMDMTVEVNNMSMDQKMTRTMSMKLKMGE
jgi:hypothetical protein